MWEFSWDFNLKTTLFYFLIYFSLYLQNKLISFVKNQENNLWYETISPLRIIIIIYSKHSPSPPRFLSWSSLRGKKRSSNNGKLHEDCVFPSWGRNFRSLFHIFFSVTFQMTEALVLNLLWLCLCRVSGDVIWYFWKPPAQMLKLLFSWRIIS